VNAAEVDSCLINERPCLFDRGREQLIGMALHLFVQVLVDIKVLWFHKMH